jgi:hypothetical protein
MIAASRSLRGDFNISHELASFLELERRSCAGHDANYTRKTPEVKKRACELAARECLN